MTTIINDTTHKQAINQSCDDGDSDHNASWIKQSRKPQWYYSNSTCKEEDWIALTVPKDSVLYLGLVTMRLLWLCEFSRQYEQDPLMSMAKDCDTVIMA